MKPYCLPAFLLILVHRIPGTVGYGAKNHGMQKDEFSNENYEELYKRGRDSYLDNDFKSCVRYIEAALSEYKSYNKLVNSCKQSCKIPKKKEDAVVRFTDEYFHYEGLIRETLCLMKCKRGKINPNKKEVIEDKVLVQDFETFKTYDYLQLCYFQTKEFQKAANAAYTNALYNPDHEIMKENLRYYLDVPEVEKEALVNLEEPEFVKHFTQGKKAYSSEDWNHCIENIEKALKLFIQEEEMCRLQCEKPFDMGWYPDFVSSVSNHFTFCLKCKLNCATKLHSINGYMEEDLVALFLHYLQFSYYKVSDYTSAVDCALTYLQFRPESEDMQNNLQYYRLSSDYDGNLRQDVKEYLEREQDELNLLQFIEESFVFNDENLASDASAVEVSNNTLEKEESDQPAKEANAAGANEQEDNGEEIWAKWSSLEGRYVLSEEETSEINSVKPALLSPPPIVKFEL